MAEGRLRHRFDEYLGKAEVAIYSILAAMLSVTAFATIATAGNMLWDGFRHWTIAAQTLRVLNELLIVLMLVEILHTVRISIRSHVLVTEPFLVVGLIASIRRTCRSSGCSPSPPITWSSKLQPTAPVSASCPTLPATSAGSIA